jgi:ATP-dependent RNA helicase RhlE
VIIEATAPTGPTFVSLNLAAPVMRALADEGYVTPTPIQAAAIPPIMVGKDILGCAQTGTGKTAAFALPILHELVTATPDKARRGPVLPRVLVLSPTRELATQIAESFATYGKHTGVSGTVIYGGVSQFRQVRALERGVDVIVATPGRLMDLMEQGHVNLTAIEVLVLDEADRMLDMGFIQPIRHIAAKLPKERQTLLFSATMPREIQHLADSLLRDPVRLSVTPVASAAPLIEQVLYHVPRSHKQPLLEALLRDGEIARAVVFTKTKHGADKVARKLNAAGISADAIHGNKAQNARERALHGFRTGRCRVLVATDVAARGLDVDAISHVFNFDLPMEPEAYVHRIGRTGRAGAKGIAVAFCDGDERGLLRGIERLTGKRLNTLQLPDGLKAEAPTPRSDDDRETRSHSPSPYGTGQGHGHGTQRPRGHARPSEAGHSFGGGKPRSKSNKKPANGENSRFNSEAMPETRRTYNSAKPAPKASNGAGPSSSGGGAGGSGAGSGKTFGGGQNQRLNKGWTRRRSARD